jgi:hypothetical protein
LICRACAAPQAKVAASAAITRRFLTVFLRFCFAVRKVTFSS